MVVGMPAKRKDSAEAAAAPGNQKTITCCICNGMKTRGRKARQCKTCKGTGVLTMNRFDGLFSIVKEEMSSYVEHSTREIIQKYAVVQKAKEAPAVIVEQVEQVAQVEHELEAQLVSVLGENDPIEI